MKKLSRPPAARFSPASLWFAASVLAVAGALSLRADVKLPALFTDNMVLQQGIPAPVWGWADDDEKVTVKFAGQTASATAAHGKWMVKLEPLNASTTPATLTVAGKNSIKVENVLVGEVWIASGQSNMEWPLRLSFESEADIAGAANPNLRLFTVPKLKARAPVTDVSSAWASCNSQSVSNFSAVAYFFARDLQKARGVPVGIIHTSWGGSPAEVWMSLDALVKNPRYQSEVLDGYATALKDYETALTKFEAEQAELKKEGKTSEKKPPGKPFWKPTELYNGMIAPLLPFAIHGAIWYQGESNAGRAHQYRTLYADMITNWRRDWGQGDFTFLAVQLAPFTKIKEAPSESSWAELREAQNLAAKVLPKVGVAVITDVGEETDIHPRKKEPVGARLALAARGIAYGEKIVFSGPAYKCLTVRGGTAVLSFDSVGAGLEARGGGLKGFSIAGADRKFAWAKAEIEGGTVVVSSPDVPQPVAVRYGWADFPVVNLWNKGGLPASPFRTDDFPMITAPKTN